MYGLTVCLPACRGNTRVSANIHDRYTMHLTMVKGWHVPLNRQGKNNRVCK